MKVIASPYLKAFLTGYYKNPSRADYNIVFSRRLFGHIDLKKLKLAFKKTIEESVILNSHLYIDDKENIFWESNNSKAEKKLSYFQDLSKKCSFIKEPFDLFTGPLYRFALFKIDIQIHDVVIILHHTIIDAKSINMLINRISSYYNEIPVRKFPTLEEQKSLSLILAMH